MSWSSRDGKRWKLRHKNCSSETGTGYASFHISHRTDLKPKRDVEALDSAEENGTWVNDKAVRREESMSRPEVTSPAKELTTTAENIWKGKN